MIIVIALIFFLVLVIVHEYGHFLAAKRNGVEVEEFGIGFPPKIAGKKIGKGIFRSYYSVNILPFGGFVKLKGESDSDKTEGGFGAASFWVKTKIILAGVFMNLAIAVLIFTVLSFTGIPSLIKDQYQTEDATILKDYVAVGYVDEDSPGKEIGLEIGDEIVSIGETEIDNPDTLFDTTDKFAGETVEVVYTRDGDTISELATLNSEESGEPHLGVGPAHIQVNSYGIVDSFKVGFATTIQIAKETYKGLGGLVADLFDRNFQDAADQVSGPVGVFVILNNASIFGFEYLLFFIGVISLTLAIMNSLPIPALDGGRLFVSGIFNLLKIPLKKKTEEAIHGTGFVILMFLIVLITVVDVQRFF